MLSRTALGTAEEFSQIVLKEGGGLQVRLFRSAGRTIAVVGESDADVDAISRALLVTHA